MKSISLMVFAACFLIAFPLSAQKTIKDNDGNLYKTVKLGKQVWMAENLRTKTYNDGSAIKYIDDATKWSELTSGAFCYYDDNENFAGSIGALYNWHAVKTGKLCPKGWRVPTESDWEIFKNYLHKAGYSLDGNADNLAKSLASTSGWGESEEPGTPGNSPSANNSTGFGAKSTGLRYSWGEYDNGGRIGYIWLNSESNESESWFIIFLSDAPDVRKIDINKKVGFPVRCVKGKAK
ncbi:MAG: hypothetical protein KA793_08720 [Bacteroidales bacterium]|nr:hypothetical protein [Bacteroidales bacterium]